MKAHGSFVCVQLPDDHPEILDHTKCTNFMLKWNSLCIKPVHHTSKDSFDKDWLEKYSFSFQFDFLLLKELKIAHLLGKP